MPEVGSEFQRECTHRGTQVHISRSAHQTFGKFFHPIKKNKTWNKGGGDRSPLEERNAFTHASPNRRLWWATAVFTPTPAITT